MSFLFIVLYFIFIFLVLEIAVVLLVSTGLEVEVARFQVVSMLTATGFTTDESELIARHPIRRKISIFLILFGVFSLAVLISFISAILIKDFRLLQLVGIAAFFAIVLLVVKNKAVQNRLAQRFKKHLKSEYELHEMPIQEILYMDDQDWIVNIQICKDSTFIHSKIAKLILPDEDIQVLYVHRGQAKIRNELSDILIQEGDILLVYGLKTTIEEKFQQELTCMVASLEKQRKN
ncbi:hypothetical protein EHS13_07710 [Paenibacillus psychroresistens]|uniref:RCK C-terminal domain-containing protein n=1 Tax=Paenibacillus psychroresistens TaxID=1778678 RepID=A0A6B8RGW4_9BACL|nr:hypothetical protein [Paenibacillus psychroresistens]QGQ94773.1 hypothetical protein EHS13_07710 [Paenibacillus psychroresistens]